MALIDPNNPSGQSDQQPGQNQTPPPNPDLTGIANDLKQVSKDISAATKSLLEAMKDMPTLTKSVAKELEGVGNILEADLENIEDIVDAHKSLHTAASEYRKLMLKGNGDLKQTATAFNKIIQAQKDIQKVAEKNSKEYLAAEVHLQKMIPIQTELNTLLANNGKNIPLDKMREYAKLMGKVADEGERTLRSIRALSVGHGTRQLASMSQTLQQVGIGKGRVEKYVGKGMEIKTRTAEYKRARQEDNITAAKKQKDDAVETIRKNAKEKFNVDINPEKGEKNRLLVAKQMKMGKSETAAYVRGDETEAFKHGTGGMFSKGLSKASGLIETGVEGMGGLLSKAAPYLAVAELVKEGFDKMVEQNKSMETGLGKAGLFSQEGTTGFGDARQNLTPGGTSRLGYNQLGLSFDRNLKIASAMQEGGLGLRELVTGEGGHPAGDQFGPGGFGQVQKVATGAGRVAGFSDTEGVTQILKLLTEYRTTLQSSEDFFINVRKGADAAGLSTGKYIQIIDDVNSHFNRMNKQLNQTLNVLNEMGKTGRLGSEDLKAYMDFMMTGGPPKGQESVAWNTLAIQNADSKALEAMRKGAEYNVTNAVEQAKTAGLDVTQKEMTGPNYMDKIARLTTDLAGNTTANPTQLKSMQAAIDELVKSADRYSGTRTTNPMDLAFNQTSSQTPQGLAMMNQSKLRIAVEKSGGTMKEFISSPGTFSSAHPGFTGIAQKEGFTSDMMSEYRKGRRDTASTMMNDLKNINATKEGPQRDETILSAKELLKEAASGEHPIVELDPKTVDAMSPEVLQKTITDNFDKLVPFAQKSLMVDPHFLRMFDVGDKTTSQDRDATMQKARMIGIQTQSSADMIANAFSTWFNNIIGFLGTISDSVTGTTQKDRAEAKQGYADPEDQKREQLAIKLLEEKKNKALSAATDEKTSQEDRDKATKEYNESLAQQEAIKRHGISKGDLNQHRQDISNVLEDVVNNLPTGVKTPQQIAAETQSLSALPNVSPGLPGTSRSLRDRMSESYARDTLMTLTSMGAIEDKKTGTGTMDAATYAKQAEAIKLMTAAGAIQVSEADKKGNRTITINNYSVDFSQSTTAQQAANFTAEHPMVPSHPPTPPYYVPGSGGNK